MLGKCLVASTDEQSDMKLVALTVLMLAIMLDEMSAFWLADATVVVKVELLAFQLR